MPDDRKPVPPPSQPQPQRPPQAPPLKVAPGASGPRAPIAPLPNPTLPRPTLPNQGVTLPKPAPGNSGSLNSATLGEGKPAGAPLPTTAAAKPISPSGMPPSTIPSPNKMPLGGAPVGASAPTPPTQPKTTPPPQPAEIRKSPFRFLPFVIGGLILIGIIGFIIMKLLGGNAAPASIPLGPAGVSKGTTSGKAPITLTYWGLWEPSAILTQVISDYETAHPGITINYQQQSFRDYHDRLQTAISKNQGPDIFRFHASWAPMLRNELTPVPSTIYTASDFQNIFYPIATKQLTLNGSLVGIPLEYDGLELFYNTDILNTANAQPPTTWADMKTLAKQLTITDSNGKIQRAGLAVGNATNVDHFSDILGLLLLQNGADPSDVTSQAAIDAVNFYVSFQTTDKVWDGTLPSSTTAFARGDVAMMFAPSWRVHDIQALNPNLKFATAPVPQLTANKVAWASYWAEGVNAQSAHKTEAWDFLKYMSSADTMKKFYSDASKVRAFGEIYSRKDLAGGLSSDPYVGSFVSDAPNAQDWYLNSATHDNGINDNIIKYFEDAINVALGNNPQSLSTSMQTAQQGQSQVLNQYGITVTTGVPATQTGTAGQ